MGYDEERIDEMIREYLTEEELTRLSESMVPFKRESGHSAE